MLTRLFVIGIQSQLEVIMATTKLDQLVENTRELEDFLHALIPALDKEKLDNGDDVLNYARKVKVKIPDFLKGEKVTWETEHSHSTLPKNEESIVLVRPGNPATLGIVLWCIRIGTTVVCFECGWLLCRIVIITRNPV